MFRQVALYCLQLDQDRSVYDQVSYIFTDNLASKVYQNRFLVSYV